VPRQFRLLADVEPLRESAAFRRLWVGTTLSSIGGSLTYFALVLQVYRLTGSSFAVGLLGLVQVIPLLAVGLLAGSVTDAVDRRRLALGTGTVLAAVSVALAVQAFAGLHAVGLLYGLAAIQSGVAAIDWPTRAALVPSLLPASQRTAGLALSRFSFQITAVVGPALAGVIAAAPHLGLRACYLVDGVSFLAALYGISRLPAMPPQAAARPGWRAAAEGARFIRRSQPLAGAFLADLNATVFGLPIALFPAINAARFGGSPRTLGLFTTAIGAGGVISASLSGPLRQLARPGRAMLITVAVWGAAFAGFAVASSLWLTLTTLAVAGAADMFTVVFRGGILQEVTPEPLRGRVMAADYVVGAGGGQLGNLEAGALASLTTPGISALAGGLATVAGAVVIAVLLPGFYRYRWGGRPERAAIPAPVVAEASGSDQSGPVTGS
jgi:MFS family permease